jgi:1-hydroxycarotenoid 3,4-desaturase
MSRCRVAVVGAGVGGLAAAIELAAAGCETSVFDRRLEPGGKLREVTVGGRRVDSGPTVLTMRWVFDELFDAAGDCFATRVPLRPATLLARHAWDEAHLDLHADPDASADAIGRFAGASEAAGFRSLCDRAARLFAALDRPFIRASRPSGALSLITRGGLPAARALLETSPFRSLWDVLGEHFRDPRLRQLFGRYATYCGVSPFAAPATLLLIAHVEQRGVWFVDGGMGRLAAALANLARSLGVTIRLGEPVEAVTLERGRISGVRSATGEQVAADAVVVNADTSALTEGLLGDQVRSALGHGTGSTRSFSAMTWSCLARPRGFGLLHHNVFFAADYQREFGELAQPGMPRDPTVYVCAQQRETADEPGAGADERLLVLINAPAIGDRKVFSDEESKQCRKQTLERLERSGLELIMNEANTVTTTPTDFATLFPGTGGALYGPATQGWRAAFERPGSRTAVPGLYLAGGSVHPGPGLPMAALSGKMAAANLIADMASHARLHRTAMPGGTSMR